MPPLRRALSAAALALAACTGAADVPRITALDRTTHDPLFPVAAGSKHQTVDCNDCHGEFDTFREFSCINCHDGRHSQARTDPTHRGLTGYSYERRVCYDCHPRGQGLEPGFHDRYFPIGEGSVHAAQGCADCHVDPQDRKVISCIDCHEHAEQPMGQRHAGVSDYVWTTAACLRCHPDGASLSRTAHDPRFPISAGTAHQAAGCAECHTNPGDRHQLECVSCHQQTGRDHGAVGGFQLSSSLCLRCHPDSVVSAVQRHVPFVIAPGAPHSGAQAPCLSCHLTARTDKPWGQDFTQWSCTTPCHDSARTNDQHGEVSGYRYLSSECLRCHPSGQGGD